MGAEAQDTLVRVAPKYPGRIYAPPGAYFSGPDKEMLLRAADFCLVPSRLVYSRMSQFITGSVSTYWRNTPPSNPYKWNRFEPCGLVDIEFGWNGALIVGHDTGGLGKMPGVYYKVQSSAQVRMLFSHMLLPHLW